MVGFKVCCIQSTAEADMAIAAGAFAIGLVGEMPDGPGALSDDRIAEISAGVRRRYGDAIWRVLLTSRTNGGDVADHIHWTGVNAVQIVDHVDAKTWRVIRAAQPTTKIIQVVHVESDAALDYARYAEEFVDLILLDSGTPSAIDGARSLGGTGRTHDWLISKQIVAEISRPVLLAGGLRPDNVAAAVATVAPHGLDICSGLRNRDAGYALEQSKLDAFATALASAPMETIDA